MQVKITIDGQQINARSGENIIDVAGQNGIYIPSLCYVKGKPCLGNLSSLLCQGEWQCDGCLYHPCQ